MRIREMAPQDARCAAEIEKETFSRPWSEQGFLDSLSRPDTLFLVAVPDDACFGTASDTNCPPEIAGYVGMYLSFEEGEITNVAVSEAFRRRGVGRRLLLELIERAAARGISRIVLEVRVSNFSAIAMYEQLGFRRIGTRRGFYDFPKEDADIMEWSAREME